MRLPSASLFLFRPINSSTRKALKTAFDTEGPVAPGGRFLAADLLEGRLELERGAIASSDYFLQAVRPYDSRSLIGLRVARANYTHWSDESVRFVRYGFQKPKCRGVVAHCGANFSHNVVDVRLGIDEWIRAHNLPTISWRETSCSRRLTSKISNSLGFFSSLIRRPWRRSS